MGMLQEQVDYLLGGTDDALVIEESKAVKVKFIENESPSVTLLKKMKKDGLLKQIGEDIDEDELSHRVVQGVIQSIRKIKRGNTIKFSSELKGYDKYLLEYPTDADVKIIYKPTEVLKLIEEQSDYFLGGDGVLEESINDKGLFKAFFLAGGPGSGKSFISNKAFGGTGARLVNSDELLEYLLIKNNLPLKLDSKSPEWDNIQKQRKEAKRIVKNKQANYINGMLPLIIDGTGKDFGKISKQAMSLSNIGYDVHMIFVNTTLEVAQDRNTQRARTVPANIVEQGWKEVQANIGKFQKFFGRSFLIVDNSKKLDASEVNKLGVTLSRQIGKWLTAPLKNQKGRLTIKVLKETKGKYLSDLPKELVTIQEEASYVEPDMLEEGIKMADVRTCERDALSMLSSALGKIDEGAKILVDGGLGGIAPAWKKEMGYPVIEKAIAFAKTKGRGKK